MFDRNLFHALEGFGACCNIMDGVKNFCAVISRSARITNTYDNPFENDETLLVLKGLQINLLWSHGAVTVLAWVIVRSFFSGTC